jgi:hypothetical protein
MKICGKCGYQNWTVSFNAKGDPQCSNCGDKMSDGSARPMLGHSYRVPGSNLSGNYATSPIKDSDDI